ncbi:sel1 repeat family protein [Duganella sp. FT50W]|uniref:Sel1 repeat family protein n=1 Tax=Duganella lactea TaxID=2692173 RepID=A0A6L8MR46_9BURK|nr:tetratricopeptide repeat protein [Duganella lactea]MYM35701.1 sel1 repeat family protein [Duganella lactea]MYM84328.1 sel1 repeat family protein [Duganella lactea]
MRALITLALAAALLAGCQIQHEKPTSAQIEVIGMKAKQEADPHAERKLMAWSLQNMPVAQRELAILYQTRAEQRDAALKLFAQAARGGDVEAAFQLGEMLRVGVPGVPAAPAAAAPWYAQAAKHQHAKAALALALLYKNGNGVRRDDAQAAHWLTAASNLGNAHAMFLLSNLYNEGQGVPQDRAQARALLEEAAEHEYPPALQELAMTVELGDDHSPKDTLRASHLIKEASEHRRNNWNRF